MGTTVSFVARDELAEWLESRAEEEMKSVSAVCQDIIAAEYRRQNRQRRPKPGQKTDRERMEELGIEETEEAESLGSVTTYEFQSKAEADAVRTEFSEYVHDSDDARLKQVVFEEGTPGDVVGELERRIDGVLR